MLLVTRDAVRDALGLDSPAAPDAAVDRFIARASGIVAAHCGWTFEAQDVVEVFRDPVRPGEPLVLARWPVLALTSVTTTSGLVDPAGRAYQAGTGLLWRLTAGRTGSWTGWPITVAYRAGYEAPPPVLAEVALSLVVGAWHAGGRDAGVQIERTDGVGMTQYFDRPGGAAMALDAAALNDLAPYRVMPL